METINLPTSLFRDVDKWGHAPGSPYAGGCGIYFRDTNPPCTCGLDRLRAALKDLPNCYQCGKPVWPSEGEKHGRAGWVHIIRQPGFTEACVDFGF